MLISSSKLGWRQHILRKPLLTLCLQFKWLEGMTDESIIFSVSKSKLGCALLDLDFVAALDMQVLSWVFDVLKAKGVSEAVISRIKNISQNCLTIPVVNNMR